MLKHLPKGTLHFVEGWLPEHEANVVVLIWEIHSTTPGIESSCFAAEVIYNTHLIETLNAASLETLRSLLHEQYGPNQGPDEHVVFSHAAKIQNDVLVEV